VDSRILKPSQIGAVLSLDQNVELTINGKTQRVNSTDLIDTFLNGDFDTYEITSIRVAKYGWLAIDLATIE
jgi:hypothetical protein